MKKKKRIVAYGCSFTLGQGLNIDIETPEEPDPRSWPFKLAEILDREPVNRGIAGTSNKHIWHIALNSSYQSGDVVVFCWSCPQRTAFITHTYDHEQYPENETHAFSRRSIYNSDVRKLGTWMTEPEVETYYTQLFTYQDAILETLLYMNHANDFVLSAGASGVVHTGIPNVKQFEYMAMKNHKNPLFYNRISTLELQDQFIRDQEDVIEPAFVPHWNKIKIPFTMQEAIDKTGKTPDGHLSLEGQTYFANQLKDHLIFKGLVQA